MRQSPDREGGKPDGRPARIAHLLVVSGPSGAGKSTFIRQLLAGRLPAAIRSRLPSGCETWPQVDGNDILKRGLSLDSVLPRQSLAPGAIVHYDIVHIHRVGFGGGYRADPAFGLLAGADAVTVVDIRPPRQRLVDQLSERAAEQRRRKGWLRVFWRKTLHTPVRALRQRLKGEKVAAKTVLYADEAWLSQCYGEWDAFSRSALEGRPGSARLVVIPAAEPGGEPSFRLGAD